ncbi:MAG: hypothetical protein E6686_10220 [Lachnospiraceae bacterium]|nr:hypothetical protein [Lachnospiraceae bacterium]MDU3181741.1 hypothetical protein [Lachnospiraceae bacterium]
MKREYLEEYLHQFVKIRLFDGEELQGYLHKTGENEFQDIPELYLKRNYYFLTSAPESNCSVKHMIFRCSHVTNCQNVL